MEKGDLGGSNAAIGFRHQYYCAIDAIMEYMDDVDFKDIQLEGKNDFTLHFNKFNISAQVKSNSQTFVTLGEIINKLPPNMNKYLIYLPVETAAVKTFINTLKIIKNHPEELDSEKNLFTKKMKIDEKSMKMVLLCDFKIIPSTNGSKTVLGSIAEWGDRNRINCYGTAVLRALMELFSNLSTEWGIVRKEKIKEIIEKNRYIPEFSALAMEQDVIGFNADLLGAIDYFIKDISSNQNALGSLINLRLLVINNNSDMRMAVDNLANENPRYEILRVGVCLLTGDKVNVNFNKEIVPDKLLNFMKLSRGVAKLVEEDYCDALDDFKNLQGVESLMQTNLPYLRGECQIKLKDYTNAAKNFEIAANSGSSVVCADAYCKLFLLKKQKDPFLQDFYDLECAKKISQSYSFSYILAIEQYVFLGRFDDAMRVFRQIKVDKLSLQNKRIVYENIAIAEAHSKKIRVKSSIIEYLKILVMQEGADLKEGHYQKYVYCGAEYTDIYMFSAKKDGYYLEIAKHCVKIPSSDYSKKIGLCAIVPPVEAGLNFYFSEEVQSFEKYHGKKSLDLKHIVDSESFQCKHSISTLVLFENTKNDNDLILNSKHIHLNHEYTNMYEYVGDNEVNASIKIEFYFEKTVGIININNYHSIFNINSVGRSTHEFKKRLGKNEFKQVVILIPANKHEKGILLYLPDSCLEIFNTD